MTQSYVPELRPDRRMIAGLLAFSGIPIDPRVDRALREGRRHEDVIDAESLILGEGQHPVIPPGEHGLAGMKVAQEIDQSRLFDPLERGPLWRGKEHAAFPGGRIVAVDRLRRD